jgi:hypothetical protein
MLAPSRVPAAVYGEPSENLSGAGRVAAQSLWLGIMALAIVLTAAGSLARLEHLAATADAVSLARLGWTPRNYAHYLTGLELVSVAAHLVTGAYIFWRRSAHRMCLLVALSLVANGVIVPFALYNALPGWPALAQALAKVVISLGLVTSLLLLYLFPTGHFVPGWTRWLALAWVATVTVALFFPGLPLSLPSLPAGVQVLALLALAGTGLYAQVHRYLNISSPVQRQQAKWAGLGLLAAVVGPLAYFLPFVILPALGTPEIPGFLYRRVGAEFFALSLGAQLVSQTVFAIALILFPVLFAIAILRFRLWDIDLLINRALVYGSLTALLALAYFLAVVLLQEALRLATGTRQSELVTVLSTLLIAALAAPLRVRVQRAIDRRFYRRKYDAVRTLAAFGSAVRDEVDLDHLTRRLLGVVEETMQPASVGLWVRGGQEER